MPNHSSQQLLDPQLIVQQAGIKSKMKVADLGCGSNGYFTFLLAHFVGREGTVYAVDIIKQTVESIRKRAGIENLRQIKTVWSNLEVFNATNIESESLDIVFLINTLFQSQKRVDLIREAMRMLKRNGKMIIVEWNNADCPLGPLPENKVDINLLKNGMNKLGMKQEDEFTAGSYHYGMVFTKI